MNLAVKEQELFEVGANQAHHGASSLVVVAMKAKEALVVGVQGTIVQPSILEVALAYINHVVNISSISMVHPTGNGH